MLLPERPSLRILGMLPHHRLGERMDGLARDQPGEDESFEERPADGDCDGGEGYRDRCEFDACPKPVDHCRSLRAIDVVAITRETDSGIGSKLRVHDTRNASSFKFRFSPPTDGFRRCSVSLAIIFGTKPASSPETEGADTVRLGRSGFALDGNDQQDRARRCVAVLREYREAVGGAGNPGGGAVGGGLFFAAGGDRSQLLSKIQSKISRLSNEQLVRVDKILAAFIG